MTAVLDRRPRTLHVVSDNMEPNIRRGDQVAVAPMDTFDGEGLYVIEQLGEPCIYRASVALGRGGGVTLSSDNPRYQARRFTRAEFEACVLGKIIAHLRVFDIELWNVADRGLAPKRARPR